MPAIGYAVSPGPFTVRNAVVEIEAHSTFAKVQTAADWNTAEPNARICLDTDSAALTAMFTRRLCRGNAQAMAAALVRRGA